MGKDSELCILTHKEDVLPNWFIAKRGFTLGVLFYFDKGHGSCYSFLHKEYPEIVTVEAGFDEGIMEGPAIFAERVLSRSTR
jgi:hypothetical protein